ncbi:MAG: patatin-like phospholipase family protein [Myxococcota bacterium]
MAGLAFSGGGIRSATFNLGVLQALAELGLLRRFDYLSTVSGGGYIGGWLQSWLRQGRVHENTCQARQQIGEIERKLATRSASEPPEVRFLRDYSNYLTPKTGIFTADTWSFIAIYLRNLLLNLTILVLGLAAAMIMVRVAAAGFMGLSEALSAQAMYAVDFLCTVGAAAGICAVSVAFRHLDWDPHADRSHLERRRSQVRWGVIAALVLLSCSVSMVLPANVSDGYVFLAPLVAYPVAWTIAWAIGRSLSERAKRGQGETASHTPKDRREAKERRATQEPVPAADRRRNRDRRLTVDRISWWTAVYSSLLAAPLAATLLWLLHGYWESTLQHLPERGGRVLLAAFGTPLVLTIFGMTIGLQVGIAGRALSDYAREWAGRVVAWMILLGLGISAVFGIALYSGPLVAAAGVLVHGLTLSWVATTLAGLFASRQPGKRYEDKPYIGAAIRLTPYLFVLGLLVLLSVGIQAALPSVYELVNAKGGHRTLADFGLAAILAGLAVFLSWRVGVNEFSMHALYRNRLVRCYFGATRPQRRPDAFTGFDVEDDRTLLQGFPGTRPYLIVNSTLNLVAGERLAWQLRRAASFVFTPLYSGYDVPPDQRSDSDTLEPFGYRPTVEYGSGISLGTAVAISGAAVSPNMGWRTSPALAFLMTVFNLRLGWWLGNPRHSQHWRSAGPRVGLLHLLAELLGRASDRRSYVYLSDGGHFENLGLYELVRRRRRYIVVTDASEDGGMSFEDLGNAVEKCRADFGVDIEIDLSPLRKQASTGYSAASCAIGRIRYDRLQGRLESGILIYLKATLTGDEPADILTYAGANPVFPHQSTADQWFDEAQFEGYRRLGHQVVRSCFDGQSDGQPVGDGVNLETYFVGLQQRWLPRTPESMAAFSKHNAELNRICTAIRSQPELKFLDAQIFPEWSALLQQAGRPQLAPSPDDLRLPSGHPQLRQGLYTCAEIIQLMESVYLDLNLEQQFDHPDNRGWMNLFRHWSWSLMFRVSWAIIASTTGARFQAFCQRRLDLGLSPGGSSTLSLQRSPRAALSEVVAPSGLEGKSCLNFFECAILDRLKTMDHQQRADPSWQVVAIQVQVSDPTDHSGVAAFQFTVGFGLILGKELVYFRVQDHLRKMGLARRGLRLLIQQEGKKFGLGALGDLPRDLPEEPTAAQELRLQRLFYSVRSEEENVPSLNSATADT